MSRPLLVSYLSILFVTLLLCSRVTAYDDDMPSHTESDGEEANGDAVDLMTLLAGLGRVAQESDRMARLESEGGSALSSDASDPDDPTCPLHDVCPAQHRREPRVGHKPWSNGCGSAGMNLQDDWGLTKCCDEHDFCYSTCNTKRSKCDTDFATCMNAVCETMTGQSKQECSSTAGMYNFGASGFGCTSFIESQKEACICVDETTGLPAPIAPKPIPTPPRTSQPPPKRAPRSPKPSRPSQSKPSNNNAHARKEIRQKPAANRPPPRDTPRVVKRNRATRRTQRELR